MPNGLYWIAATCFSRSGTSPGERERFGGDPVPEWVLRNRNTAPITTAAIASATVTARATGWRTRIGTRCVALGGSVRSTTVASLPAFPVRAVSIASASSRSSISSRAPA